MSSQATASITDPTDITTGPNGARQEPAAGVEDGVENDAHPDESVVWTRFGAGPLPRLPRMAAVHRAYKAGVDFGLPEGFAGALAHAAVDPASVRVALGSPTRLNVPGGVIEVIDVDLWTPGVIPIPTNNRTMDQRVYPAAGATGVSSPLAGHRSVAGVTSTLAIRAQSVEHALDQAQRAANFVLAKNPLAESIAARGIVMSVDVVHVELQHADGQPAIPLLATAEGSSRATNAHKVLGLHDPKTTHYDFVTDRDTYRRFLSGIVEGDLNDLGLSARGRQKLREKRNAVIVSARVFLRFTPAEGATYDYARALNAYLGMLHVDPPRAWSQTGKSEAMAEAVLEVLRAAEVLDDKTHDYLSGLLPPDVAGAAGLPIRRDEQAAYVLAELLPQGRRELVDRGIRDVTAKRTVSSGRKADVVAELALRPTRSQAVTLPLGDPVRERAERMRASYLRCSRLPGFATRPWCVTGRTPEQLLDAALHERRRPGAEQANPANWAARLELAALAQYHLTQWGALKREPMGGDDSVDKRGPQDILAKMLDDDQGLRILRQAIVDGRAGRPPRVVDENGASIRARYANDGTLIEDPDADPAELTDTWLRYEAFPRAVGGLQRRIAPVSETPAMRVTRLQDNARAAVEELVSTLDELEKIKTQSGRPILDERGWTAGDLVETLSSVERLLVGWSFVAQRQPADQTEEETADDENGIGGFVVDAGDGREEANPYEDNEGDDDDD